MPPAAELGQTTDPKALIPGNPETVTSAAKSLRDNGSKMEDIGQDLGNVRIDSWQGQASNAFWDVFSPEKKNWFAGNDAMEGAAKALDAHADALRTAQEQAAEAIRQWERGEAATKQAKSEHEQAAAQGGGGEQPEFSDPGEALRQQARETLERARKALEQSGTDTAGTIDGHGGKGDGAPAWLSKAADVVGAAIKEHGAGKFTVSQDVLNYGDEGPVKDENKKQFGHQQQEDPNAANKPSVSVSLGELKGEANLFEVGAKGEWKVGDATLSGSAEVKGGAEGSMSGSIGSDGLKGEIQGKVGVTASAEGKAEYGPAAVTGKAEGFAGAEAGAEASVGPGGVNASAEAFAGAKAEGDVGAEVGGVGAGLHGEAWAGAGAEAGVHAGMEDGKFKIGGELGVGLGVGAKLGTEVTIDPAAVADTAGDVAGKVGDVAGDVGSAVGDTAKDIGGALNPFD